MLLKDIADYDAIYLACGNTDLRKGIDGLAALVQQEYKLDPFANCLFLFCNRERNRLKGLSWDKNGFIMCIKRLDGQGAKLKWPKTPEDMRSITPEQLHMLMEGLSIDPPKGFGEIRSRKFF